MLYIYIHLHIFHIWGSILIWQKKYLHENWSAVHPSWSESVRARLYAMFSVFTVFFMTWSFFGFFQLFLNLLEDSSDKNAYKHNIVGLTIGPGSPFLRFENCISLNAVLSKFQLLRQVRSLAVFFLTIGLCNVQLISFV